MKAYDLNRADTIKEIRRINRNLSARLKRIRGDENLPKFAVEGYDKMLRRVANYKQKAIDEAIAEGKSAKEAMLSDSQLTTILRDIRYINDLKSSRVLSAKYVAEVYTPIKTKLEALSPEQAKRAWKIYEKVQGEAALLDRFKYEIVATATDYIYGGQTDDDAIQDLISEFDKVYEKFTGDIDSAEARVLFTEYLDELRKQFE